MLLSHGCTYAWAWQGRPVQLWHGGLNTPCYISCSSGLEGISIIILTCLARLGHASVADGCLAPSPALLLAASIHRLLRLQLPIAEATFLQH